MHNGLYYLKNQKTVEHKFNGFFAIKLNFYLYAISLQQPLTES